MSSLDTITGGVIAMLDSDGAVGVTFVVALSTGVNDGVNGGVEDDVGVVGNTAFST